MWDVWIEGYRATEEYGTHEFLGKFRGKTFQEACKAAAMEKLARCDMDTFNKYYNEKRNTWWGCHFYDNEADAAKDFG